MTNSRLESDFITIPVLKMDFVTLSMSFDYFVSSWLVILHYLLSRFSFLFLFSSYGIQAF